MAVYEIEKNGEVYEIEASSQDKALQALKSMGTQQAPQQQEKPQSGTFNDIMATLNQGLTFGFGDEILSAVHAPFDAYSQGIGLGEAYQQNQEAQRQNREQFYRDSPIASTTLEMAGGIPSGVATGTAMLSRTALGNAAPLVQATGLGALEGALYGAGTADEGERTQGAATGGALGGVMGPLGLKLGEGIGGAARPMAKYVTSRLSDTPEKEARRVIRRGLLSEFGDADEAVDAYRATGREGMLVDASDNVKDYTKGALGRLEGGARKNARQVMDQRQAGQQGRLLSMAADDLGIADSRQARDMMQDIAQARSAQAKPLYEAAYQQDIPLDSRLGELMKSRPSLKKAWTGARGLMEEEGLDPNVLTRGPEAPVNQKALGEGSGSINVRVIDYLKRALDDQYRRAVRSSPQKARAIDQTRKELLSFVDDAVPEYKQARNVWAGGKALEDSRDLGRNIFSRKEDLFDIEDRVASMTDSERMTFKAGVMEAVEDKIQSAGETQNSVSRLLRNTDMKNRLRNAFDSDEQFEEFVRQAEQEDAFSRTRNYLNVRGGSQTKLLENDMESVNNAAQGRGALSQAMTEGDGWFGTAMRAAQVLAGDEASDETFDQIVKIATDNNLSEQSLRQLINAKDPVTALDRLKIPRKAKAELSGLIGLQSGVLSNRDN